jgi:hypothetical protein
MPFRTLVPQVNAADGNETSGVRLPIIQVPLATYMGWNLRHPDLGAPDELFSMVGSYVPFARTRDERIRSGDPRPSMEELYKTRQDYMNRISAVSAELVAGRYLLAQDVPALSEQAGLQWDYHMSRSDSGHSGTDR